MSRGARILFVEDEAAIAEPFGRALAREGFEVIAARSVAEARARFARQPPDLVLLDLTLPDGDGRDLCRELRSASQRADHHAHRARNRARPRHRPRDRRRRLRGQALQRRRGRRPHPRRPAPSRRRAGGRGADRAGRPRGRRRPRGGPRVDGRELALSRKEFDLLAELARHAGTVVTREELMARVWDENWFGSTKTLDVHMGWLRRKLGDDASMPRYLHTVRGVGFRLVAPEDERPRRRRREPPRPAAAGPRLRPAAGHRGARGPARLEHPPARRRRGALAGARAGRRARGHRRRPARPRAPRRAPGARDDDRAPRCAAA